MRSICSSKPKRTLLAWIQVATFVMLAVMVDSSALAQGGPPLVTDDPETPGNGRWEINLAAIGAHTPGRWEVAAPDADINYGWGDRVQLKVDIPWVFARESGQAWKAGLGSGDFGVKWRFIDQDESGFSMSTYPQLTRNLLPSSTRRGITAPDKELLLPVEVATEVGGFGLDAEVGRNFVEHEPDQWVAGVIVAHSCAENVECLAELHETSAPHDRQTLVNLGVHWKLSDSLILLAAAGREFGSRTDSQRSSLVYLGLQLLK
jgi:hypothetical protein